MRLQVRITLVTTLGLALWALADGLKCLLTGRFFGQAVLEADLDRHPFAIRLPDGDLVDYGLWAAALLRVGLDPHALAPFFVGLGGVGLVGLVLFLQARPVGWALLVSFAVLSGVRLGPATAVAAVLLVVLLLPATRRLLEWGPPPQRASTSGPPESP